MIQFKKQILTLCLILFGACCYAIGARVTESQEKGGTPKLTIIKSHHAGSDKSGSISASINGHYLAVAFTENLGQVAVEITTASGTTVENYWSFTPIRRLSFS